MSQTYKLNEKLTPYSRDQHDCTQFRRLAHCTGISPRPHILPHPGNESYKLEWQTTGGPRLILRRMMIKVVDEARSTILETTLAGVYLREGYSGSVASEGDKRFYGHEETFTFGIELDCVAGDLRPRAELDAARLGLELAHSTFIETERKTFAKHANESTSGQVVVQDVAFVFPSSQRVLWASENALTQASPYLKELLESSFIEGPPQTSFDAAFDETAGLIGSEFDDSDDENDTRQVAAAPASNREPKAPFKLVRIAQMSYTTYAAVLV